MGRRYYSAQKIGKVRALYMSNAGYVKPTAAAENVGRSTVRSWAAGVIPDHVDPAEVERATFQASAELAALWERAATLGAQGLIDALEDETRRGKMTARDLALAAAIATDKRNLLTGQATERVETLDLATFLSSVNTHATNSMPSVSSQDTAASQQEQLPN